jgi:hypothetical protein
MACFVRTAVFAEKMQLDKVVVPRATPLTNKAPPSSAEFPEKVQSDKVAVPLTYIAPPTLPGALFPEKMHFD